MTKVELNKRQMRLSKKPERQLKHAKCPNCHCVNYCKLSESNCILQLEDALKCIYNKVNQYERGK